MAANHPDIGAELEELAARFGHEELDRGLGLLRDTRFGRSTTGQAALGAVGEMIAEHGIDSLEWLVHRIRARQAAKTAHAASAAGARIDDAAERARERLAKGEGHQ